MQTAGYCWCANIEWKTAVLSLPACLHVQTKKKITYLNHAITAIYHTKNFSSLSLGTNPPPPLGSFQFEVGLSKCTPCVGLVEVQGGRVGRKSAAPPHFGGTPPGNPTGQQFENRWFHYGGSPPPPFHRRSAPSNNLHSGVNEAATSSR